MAYNYGGIFTWVAKNWNFSPEALMQGNARACAGDAAYTTTFRLVPLGFGHYDEELIDDNGNGGYTFTLVRDVKAVSKPQLAPLMERVKQAFNERAEASCNELWAVFTKAPKPIPDGGDGSNGFVVEDEVGNARAMNDYVRFAELILEAEARVARVARVIVRVEELPHGAGHLVLAFTGNPHLHSPLSMALFGSSGLLQDLSSESYAVPAVRADSVAKYRLKPLVRNILLEINDDLEQRTKEDYVRPEVLMEIVETTWVKYGAPGNPRMTLKGREIVDELWDLLGSEMLPTWTCTKLKVRMQDNQYGRIVTYSLDGMGNLSHLSLNSIARGMYLAEDESAVESVALTLDAVRSITAQAPVRLRLYDHSDAVGRLTDGATGGHNYV